MDAQDSRGGAKNEGDSLETIENGSDSEQTPDAGPGETRSAISGDSETARTDGGGVQTADPAVIFTIGHPSPKAEQGSVPIASPAVVEGEPRGSVDRNKQPGAPRAGSPIVKSVAVVGRATESGGTVFSGETTYDVSIDPSDAPPVGASPNSTPRAGDRASGPSVPVDGASTNTTAPIGVAGSGGGDGASSDGDSSSSRRDTGSVFRLVTEETGGSQRVEAGEAFRVVAPPAPGVREPVEGARASVLKVTGADAEVSPANERAVAASVSRGLAAAVQQRGGSLTIRLSPESLGQVRVELEMSQGRVTAALHASTEQAQEAMSRSITMLRSSLESKGLTVDRLTVQLTPSTNASQAGGNDGPGQDTSRQSAQQDRDASGGESRGSREDGRPDQQGQRRGYDERFEELFGLEPGDPRTRPIRLSLSAIG